MTTTNNSPVACSGFPGDPEQRSRQATNKCIAQNSNAIERSRRQILVSQEGLAQQIDDLRQMSGSAQTATIVIAEEIAEEQRRQGLQLEQILCLLRENDFLAIPREESNYTFELEEGP